MISDADIAAVAALYTTPAPASPKPAMKAAEDVEDDVELEDEADEDADPDDVSDDEADEAEVDDGDDAEDGDADGEEADEDAEEPEADEPDLSARSVDVDGTKLTVADLTNSHREFSKAKADLAKLDADLKAQIAEYEAVLPKLHARLAAMEPQRPDIEALFDTDPVEAIRQKHLWDQVDAQKAAAEAEIKRVAAEKDAKAAEDRGKKAVEAYKRIVAEVPALKDEKAWKSNLTKMASYAQKRGVSPEELEAFAGHDARLFMILRDAAQWAAATDKNAKPAKPVTMAPRTGRASVARPVRGDREIAKRVTTTKVYTIDDLARLYDRK